MTIYTENNGLGVLRSVANLYMEDFEKRALKTSVQKPKVWIRYVDVTFVIWPHSIDNIENFHQHLNKIHPSIQFNIERENNNKWNFLDVLVDKDKEENSTTIVQKTNSH